MPERLKTIRVSFGHLSVVLLLVCTLLADQTGFARWAAVSWAGQAGAVGCRCALSARQAGTCCCSQRGSQSPYTPPRSVVQTSSVEAAAEICCTRSQPVPVKTGGCCAARGAVTADAAGSPEMPYWLACGCGSEIQPGMTLDPYLLTEPQDGIFQLSSTFAAAPSTPRLIYCLSAPPVPPPKVFVG